eukprot:6408680-Prymnesium_polylepis.1
MCVSDVERQLRDARSPFSCRWVPKGCRKGDERWVNRCGACRLSRELDAEFAMLVLKQCTSNRQQASHTRSKHPPLVATKSHNTRRQHDKRLARASRPLPLRPPRPTVWPMVRHKAVLERYAAL